MVILAALAVPATVFLPHLWVRYTIDRHSVHRPDLPGTGGELARHLLDRFGLGNVAVDATELGDHYDPEAKTVGLLKKHLDGRSFGAVAIAAHGVSHALQDARGERLLALRQALAKFAASTDRIAAYFLIAAPVLGVLARAPLAFAALVGIGVSLLVVCVVVSLVTLPVEIDAGFSKALPILKDGNYVASDDMPAVQSLLRAAAFTHLAGALIHCSTLRAG